MKRFVLLGVLSALGLSGCAVPSADDGEPEKVAATESELPIIPICPVTTFNTYATSSPYPSSTSGHVEESIDLGFAGDRDDVAWVERSLSAPSPLRPRVSVSTTIDVSNASVELFSFPLGGYSAGGVNLLLEVKDGARVLCSQRVVLLNRSTPAGKIDQFLAPNTQTLSCGFNSTGLTNTPTARVSLETWATVGGFSTAYIRASGQVREIRETRCLSFPF